MVDYGDAKLLRWTDKIMVAGVIERSSTKPKAQDLDPGWVVLPFRFDHETLQVDTAIQTCAYTHNITVHP